MKQEMHILQKLDVLGQKVMKIFKVVSKIQFGRLKAMCDENLLFTR